MVRLPIIATIAALAVQPLLPREPVHKHEEHGLLIQNGTVVDGTGARRYHADLRIEGDTIVEIGKLTPKRDEKIVNASGMIVAPGFIDTLSHADSGIGDDPLAQSQIRQGITTAVVGFDGASNSPLKSWFGKIDKLRPALNFASFAGHGTVRHEVMGEDYKRKSTADEREKMAKLVETEMQSGAIGLSSGLEYDPGYYSDTDELIDCSKAAAKYGGIYASHVRDEGDHVFEAFRELIRISESAHIPANISHIKLATTPGWHHSKEVLKMLTEARKNGADVTADVYPYTYWQSTITVLIPTRNWNDRKAWALGLKEVGGAGNVLLGAYIPDSTWVGKTLKQISANTHKDPVSVAQEIVSKTQGMSDSDRDPENVVVSAMAEDDVRTFVQDPHITICSDGSMDDSHPRGAGTFPRVLGVYVRDRHALTLEQAIHKMTQLSARRMGFADRGALKPGMKADVTIFNPQTVRDTATTRTPSTAPIGIPFVLVNGKLVLENGFFTGDRPGRTLRRAGVPQTGVKVL